MRVRKSIWRGCSLVLRVLGIDARAYFPLLPVLFLPNVPKKWTVSVALISIAAFYVMEKKGLTLPVLVRKIRHRLRGTKIHARAWWHHRRYD